MAVAQGTQTATQMMDPRVAELQALQPFVNPLIAGRFPDIVQMLFETPSLKTDEKKYWLQLLPLMTLDQIGKLREILTTERRKLIEIQQKYAQPLMTIGDTEMLKQEQISQKRSFLKKQEAVDQNVESKDEEGLLKQLNQLS